MSKEYKAKVFKSGNSLALRLPKALGVKEGTEMMVREQHGKFAFQPIEQPKRKLDIDKIWGCAASSGLELIKRKDRIFEHRPLVWEDPEWLSDLEDRG